MSKAEEILKAAFNKPRNPRSNEYKCGALAALKYRLGEEAETKLPYVLGSVQADAWFSGLLEGRFLAKEYQESALCLTCGIPLMPGCDGIAGLCGECYQTHVGEMSTDGEEACDA